jgi:hypothetical protein
MLVAIVELTVAIRVSSVADNAVMFEELTAIPETLAAMLVALTTIEEVLAAIDV